MKLKSTIIWTSIIKS